MKLQKLIIHNIASIADATIDFEHGVLSEEPLFLICGDTGTGKSTILNCICMALFNMVPSMPSQKGSYKFEDTTVGNPANLMRRGTGEASISLFFSEDNKPYEVDWMQRRARNKADGRFQPLSRILKDIETGETLASKEVSEKIEEIIGLDYTRFTRMFLLAQGQFNKFLSANDNDKSQILESLTSLDIYKGIGVYIHDRSAKEKEVFDRIKQRIEDIHLLTDEEKEAKSKEMNDDLEEIGKLSVQRTILEGKLNWRKSVSENQKAAEEAKSHIDAAKLQVESEENQNRMVLLQLWDSTGDLRSCKTLIASLKDSIKENNEKLQTNRTVFLQYRMGLDQSKKKLEELQEQLKEKESDLKQLSLNHDRYENVQTILAAFKTISNLESSNTTLNQKINDNVEKSKQLDLKISDAEKNYKQKLADETSCKTERDKKQQEFDDSGKEKLQAQYNQLQTEVTDITSGKGKWQLAKNASVAVAEKQEEITTTRDELAKLTKQQEAAEKSSVEKDDLYNKCKEACDLRKLTIDECSQKLRQSLEDGKPCPICGSVHHEVKEEKFFEDLYDQANEELAKAQKEKDDARNSWMRLQAQTKEKENGLKIVSEKLLPQLQNKLDGTMKDWEPFAEKFAKNVAFDEADILLENEEKSRRVKLIELGESLKAASQLEKELDALRQKYETAQSLTATAKKTYDDLLTDQKTLVHDNETYQSQIDDNKTSVQTSIDTVNDWMTDEDWMLSWNQDRVLYEKRLKEAAKKYQDYTLQIPLLKKSIEQKAADIRQSDEEITKMITLLPDWDKADESVSEISSSDVSASKWSSLAATVEEIVRNLNKDQAQLSDCVTQQDLLLKSYQESHTTIEPSQLDWLFSTTDGQIKQLRTESDQLATALSSAQGELKHLTETYDKLMKQADKPTEEETGSLLSVQKVSLEDRNTELQNAIGGLKVQLEEDKSHESVRKTLLTEQQQQKEIYDRWSTLNTLFGNDRLTKAAQCITFRFLLEKANEHLEQLYPRYRLECPNDSLALLVDDLEMGTTRPGTTLSGGESFIVSLALALGLSSLSDDRIRVETLFIDEGFGTLSEECLNTVMNVLENLHRQGRKVGIVSHVQMLRERIPAQIRLERVTRSKSEVHVVRL